MALEPELADLLAGLGLQALQPLLEEEAITELPLLQSMGGEMLEENLSEIGVSKEDIARWSAHDIPLAPKAAPRGAPHHPAAASAPPSLAPLPLQAIGRAVS